MTGSLGLLASIITSRGAPIFINLRGLLTVPGNAPSGIMSESTRASIPFSEISLLVPTSTSSFSAEYFRKSCRGMSFDSDSTASPSIPSSSPNSLNVFSFTSVCWSRKVGRCCSREPRSPRYSAATPPSRLSVNSLTLNISNKRDFTISVVMFDRFSARILSSFLSTALSRCSHSQYLVSVGGKPLACSYSESRSWRFSGISVSPSIMVTKCPVWLSMYIWTGSKSHMSDISLVCSCCRLKVLSPFQ